MADRPRVFNWIGNSAPTLYWDDPNNWEGREYPNHPEAIAIFADTLTQDTTILIRQDIRLAHFWFSEEKYSYTIAAEVAAGQPPESQPKLILDTARQFSTSFFDNRNMVDHTIAAMINHSCHFGFPDRNPRIMNPDYMSTLHFNGEISNYKDPDRASLQVYGRSRFQLNAANTFKGPVIVLNNGEVRATKNGAIPDGTPITLENQGRIGADDGVLIRAGSLRVDGQDMGSGLYHADGLAPNIPMFSNLLGIESNELTENGINSIPNITGKGAILVA